MNPVEIITIGDELLIGQVVDTNSTWIQQELNKTGFDVRYKTTVGDNEPDILDAFERACSRASIVLVTGGIGPTKDDITKKTLCRFFNTELIFDNNVLHTIEQIMKAGNRTLNELTRTQAFVPADCTVIQNRLGTAPVTWFEKNGAILVSMPGVPYEMKGVMETEILPRLQNHFKNRESIQHQTFLVGNYSESMLAMHLESFEDALPENIKLAYLPSYGLIRLRITGKHSSESILKEQMEKQRIRLTSALGKDIISEMDQPLESLLGRALLKENLSLSLAESCTGGKMAALITSISGSSAYFKGSVVAYSNEIKQSILQVSSNDLAQYGAVSEPVVRQMAAGAQQAFGTDCAIATSGVAGPGGGTAEKPVGTVWIAAACRDKVVSEKFHFSQSREGNILRASNTGMLMLLDLILEVSR